MIVELRSFTVGKKTGRGPNSQTYPVVTVVTRDAIDSLLGTSPRTRSARLRKLRDQGRLVCRRPGRLTQVVRDDTGSRFRAYVFAGGADQLPILPRQERKPDRGRARVISV